MRACSFVAVSLATVALVMAACTDAQAGEPRGEAKEAQAEGELASVPMLVAGALVAAGGIGGGVALAFAEGPCGEVDDQCAMTAMLLGPTIAGLFIGVPMMIAGAQPAAREDEDELASVVPDVVVSPGGAGLRWRF